MWCDDVNELMSIIRKKLSIFEHNIDDGVFRRANNAFLKL